MATELKMPALSPTMEEGTLAKWLVKEGDEVKAGDVLAEIETDKATMEVEAVDEGKLAKIIVPEGSENVAVNTPIALLAGEDEDVADVASSSGGTARPQAAPQRQVPPEQAAEAKGPERAARESGPSARGNGHAAPAAAAVAPEPEWTGKTQTMTVREALRDAM